MQELQMSAIPSKAINRLFNKTFLVFAECPEWRLITQKLDKRSSDITDLNHVFTLSNSAKRSLCGAGRYWKYKYTLTSELNIND